MLDAIVVGLGVHGSASLAALAKRGLRVVGVDQFHPPHTQGSSHGETRIIREAYFEHPSYVPLAQRALSLWQTLQQESGRVLYQQTGALLLGPADGMLVKGALKSAREHGLAHEVFDAPAVRMRFPSFAPRPDDLGVLEPRAGILFVETCIETLLDAARKHGAETSLNTVVTSWSANASGVEVKTQKDRIVARKLVLAVGPWLTREMPSLPLTVERQVAHWFRPRVAGIEALPVYAIEYARQHMFYGFPDLGAGAKVALHHEGQATTANTVARNIDAAELERMRQLADSFVPGLAGDWLRGSTCLYTNTPDEHFIVDRHPAHDNVLVVSPCSGHGFKFAPVVGEKVAADVAEEPHSLDWSLFKLERFSLGGR